MRKTDCSQHAAPAFLVSFELCFLLQVSKGDWASKCWNYFWESGRI